MRIVLDRSCYFISYLVVEGISQWTKKTLKEKSPSVFLYAIQTDSNILLLSYTDSCFF